MISNRNEDSGATGFGTRGHCLLKVRGRSQGSRCAVSSISVGNMREEAQSILDGLRDRGSGVSDEGVDPNYGSNEWK